MLYLGKLHSGKYQLFRSKRKPTEESHGQDYKLTIGPFKNRQNAIDHAAWLGLYPIG